MLYEQSEKVVDLLIVCAFLQSVTDRHTVVQVAQLHKLLLQDVGAHFALEVLACGGLIGKVGFACLAAERADPVSAETVLSTALPWRSSTVCSRCSRGKGTWQACPHSL